MAKNDTKIRRVKAKDSQSAKASKKAKTQISKAETVSKEVSKKPKMSKYAAKVAGVELEKSKKTPAWIRVILAPFKFIWSIIWWILTPIRKIFAPINRYFAESWQELKLVRWPTRKETWKMTLAVIIFSVGFATLIVLLDGLFNWIFTTILGK
ncbi:MAG: preprotein translocase subunit SecE [bacterium]|nr:preprotein translocase subunit SecE [bacterium]